MCDPRGQGRNWRLYIQDMIEFAERVMFYTQGLDQDTFIADRRTYDATLRNIELIGESASHVPDKVREAHPEIAWRSIMGARNRVAHGYLGIDDDVVWDIVQSDIPSLLSKLRALLDSAGQEPP